MLSQINEFHSWSEMMMIDDAFHFFISESATDARYVLLVRGGASVVGFIPGTYARYLRAWLFDVA